MKLKSFFNGSLFITILGSLGIIYSKSISGDFLGDPMTDVVIMAVSVIIALIFAFASSNFAINHSTKEECFWDCMTDVISILIHFSLIFIWYIYGKSWFPKGFISEMEHNFVFALLLVMFIIAFFEFKATLNNCLESMLRNGQVKVNT